MLEKERASLYKDSGVDIAKGDNLVGWLQDSEPLDRKDEARGEVVSGIGGFASLYRPNLKGLKDPLIVSATDGVGTKVLLGLQTGHLRGLGQDLVAMCANDLMTLGAKPLFFLDYYASGALDEEQFKDVLMGIRDGVAACGAALIGGETAEMPGLYEKGHFDLAGFMVGLVDGARLAGASNVREGDAVIAWPSSGFHSNGYSLIRKWLLTDPQRESSDLLSHLMRPTKVYGQLVDLFEVFGPEIIHAVCHVTGGGISGNLPRVLPADFGAILKREALPTPQWMQDFWQRNGGTFEDVEPVFNLGVGMILVVKPDEVDRVIGKAQEIGERLVCIGDIVKTSGATKIQYS